MRSAVTESAGRDDVLGTLERSLRGPRRARADMIREVRDGLEDAAAAYRESGLDGREARRRAHADFGDPRDVAAGLQVELTARYGRRTAAGMALAFPALVLLWDSLWVVDTKAPRLSPVSAWLSRAIDALSLTCAVTCGVAVLLLWLGARRGVRVDVVTRGVGLLSLCALVGISASSVLMNVLSAGHKWIFGERLVQGVLLTTVLVAVWMAVSAHRCLLLGRFARTAPDIRPARR
jgi:hypothetical protein